MKKLNLIGLISEIALAVCALVCLIVSAVYGYVALIVISALVMLGILYIGGSFLANHIAPSFNYFAYPIWFWEVFCKTWVWQTFCVEWVWQTFCVKWVWQTFLVKWVWQTAIVKWFALKFCKDILWNKLRLNVVWRVFFVKWVWQTAIVKWFALTFCKKWIWEKLRLKVVVIDWIWKGLRLNVAFKHYDKWKAWVYLAPALILLAIFTVWPLFNTVKMAFTSYYEPNEVIYETDENGDYIFDDDGNMKIKSKGKWYGYSLNVEKGNQVAESKGEYHKMKTFYFSPLNMENFKTVINLDGFATIIKNTVILCVATVPLSTLLALLIAVCLNAIKPLQRFLQTIFFLPYVTNSIAIGMVFAAMFNIVGVNTTDLMASKSLGIINWLVQLLGFEPINWINQGSSYVANITVMIIYIVWNALPFKILILLGGLQSVNKQYYDAAKIDSTPRWRVFTRITVPLLSPMISYVVITGFIGGFKEYTSIVGIFGDGMEPGGASATTTVPRLQTMVGYIYTQIGKYEGTASAAAILLFLLIFAVTLVNLKVSKKNTHY